MSYFIAVVQENEDNTFCLHFPDIEGLSLSSSNMLTLLKDATDALADYFENNEALEPSSLSRISGDEKVKEHFTEGATLNLIPHRENKE